MIANIFLFVFWLLISNAWFFFWIGSFEQSPRTVEIFSEAMDHVSASPNATGENQLQEDLAEAMLETPHRPAGMIIFIFVEIK